MQPLLPFSQINFIYIVHKRTYIFKVYIFQVLLTLFKLFFDIEKVFCKYFSIFRTETVSLTFLFVVILSNILTCI